MEKRNNLPNKLKKMQMEMGKSQTEFAQELGIPQSTLQNIMKGGNTTLDTLMQIAAITGFSLDELVLDDPAAEILRKLLSQLNCYSHMTEKEQEEVRYLVSIIQRHMNILLELFRNDR